MRAAADARHRGRALLRARREGPLGPSDRPGRRRRCRRTTRRCSWCPTSRRRSTGSTRTPSSRRHERIASGAEVEGEYAAKSEKLHIIHKLLQAHALYEKDVDYLVQDGQVMIVDEFTGRVMAGRRWADGLHQAVEAKEGVTVKGETQTFATITIQNYFRMYDKLAGMTGTAETEETGVLPDLRARGERHPHQPAGRAGSTSPTGSTGPGGRSTTRCSDEVERLHEARAAGPDRHGDRWTCRRRCRRHAQAARAQARGAERQVPPARGGDRGAGGTGAARSRSRPTWPAAAPTSSSGKDLDLTLEERRALQIIGTERHESRRIDRQLRGRSGRQGDPGSVDLLPLAGRRPDASLRVRPHRPLDGQERGGGGRGHHRQARHAGPSRQAQKRVELQNFQQRKRLLEYDDVMNQQREVIYSLRLFALERGEELKAEARRMIEAALERAVPQVPGGGRAPEEWDRGRAPRGAHAPVPGGRGRESPTPRRRPTRTRSCGRR